MRMVRPARGGARPLPCIVSRTRLFLAMGNAIFNETPQVEGALRSVADLLPDTWAITQSPAPPGRERTVVDIVGPGQARFSYAVSVWPAGRSPATKAFADLVPAERDGLPVLYVADYLGPGIRQRLTENGVSFADGTGWVRISSTTAPILLTGEGADRSVRPRGSSAVVRFNGPTTGKVLRALLTEPLPIGVRELAQVAGVSPGSVSKILATLGTEDLIARDDQRRVVEVRKRQVMYRWTSDYSFVDSNSEASFYLAARGTERALSDLSDLPNVSVTGSVAARRLLPDGMTSVVPLRLVAAYAAAPDQVARKLRLVETQPATANVVIARPQDATIVDSTVDGLRLAPTPLVVADLLTLPGRGEAEADQLMDVLARDDEAWSN